ncbi:Pycsar system effector family protein [Streptomyces sp. NPDC051644]|uniref:Pycsar system effector family protein n=1 Tax=Streptomyces sp. NPDC051644 TaxID=3365666 RepID=UPI0037A053E1
MTITDLTSTNLDSAITKADTDLTRTDTKAGLLLTLDGLLVAALSLSGTDLHGLARVLAVVGAAAVIGSVVLSLLVIRPRLAGKRLNDRASYAYFATAAPDTIADALASDRRPAARLQALSRIALGKMRALVWAGDVTLVAVIAIAAAILTR